MSEENILNEVKWVDPGQRRGRPDNNAEKYKKLLYQLQERPNYWGLIATNIEKSSQAQYIAGKIRKNKYIEGLTFEALVQKEDNGEYSVSARCLDLEG